MGYYPILLDLEGKTALVVGAGRVAQRKIEALMQCGAKIHIVGKRLTGKLNELVEGGRARRIGDAFEEAHLEGAFVVIAATDDPAVNHHISVRARKKGLLVNAVDQPSDCNFIVPSVVRRGDLLIAISTSGKSPALARHIRERMETQFGEGYTTFLVLMGRLRKRVLSKRFSQEENRRIFHEIVGSDILQAMARDDWEEVESILSGIFPGDESELRDILAGLGPN
jgi:precorrin-2 dehydrogenase/sirohydrochlorin ferrochelatase